MINVTYKAMHSTMDLLAKGCCCMQASKMITVGLSVIHK